jgi:hypothetical protein
MHVYDVSMVSHGKTLLKQAHKKEECDCPLWKAELLVDSKQTEEM